MRRVALGLALATAAFLLLTVVAFAAGPQLGTERAVERTSAAETGGQVKRGEELAASKASLEAAKSKREEEAEARAAEIEAREEAAEEKAEAVEEKEAEEEEEAEAAEEAAAAEAEAAAEEADSGALSSLSLGGAASTLEGLEVPVALLPVYEACGTRYGISWEVLAAINKVETGFGTDLGTSGAGAGAEGWMQFLPSSWKEWGIDADGDGSADTDDPVDAICSAARYLAASGGETDIYDAVLAYNHADWYAREVLADARRYERVAANLVDSLTGLAEGTTFPVAGGEAGEVHSAEGEETTATIDAEAGAKVSAVVDGTVAAAAESEALGRYVVLRDAAGDRIVYSDLGEVTVGAGESVAEGDTLGEVGEAGIGFSVRPDASVAIDPTELLELWKEGGVGTVYGADVENASAESKSVRSLLMSAAALRREVLADPDLALPACVRRAVNAGELRRQGLAALEYLTGRGYKVGVAASTCEHSSGFALEIDSVDDQRVSAGQGSGTAARHLVETVLAMDASTAPQLVASATGLAAAETVGTDADAIELDYQPPQQARIVDGDAVAPTDAPAAVQAMIAAANQIDTTPYIWGGGHGSWVSAGYDCSGSVSYVLHAAELLSAPETSGALESWGEPGSGNWVTVYANADHAYAVIAGLRWDTVGDASGTGPRWHTGAAYPAGFTERHPAGL